MENDNPPPPDNNELPSSSYHGYGYNYHGYEADAQQHRSLKDYFIIFRERIWLFVFCFAIIFTGILLYSLNKTPLYKSTAQIRMLRSSNAPMETNPLNDPEVINNPQDFNTWTEILKSTVITNEVEKLLNADEEKYNAFLKPYQPEGAVDEPVVAYPILHQNRRVIPKRLSLIISLEYVHPDRDIAAHVVNLYARAFQDYQKREMIQEGLVNREVIAPKIEEQTRKVDELKRELVQYREQYGGLIIDDDKDIYLRELSNLKDQLNLDENAFRRAQSVWMSVENFEKAGRSLLSLPSIAQSTHVSALQARLSQKRENVGQLQTRYRSKHPTLINAIKSMEVTKAELDSAISVERDKIYNNFTYTKQQFEETKMIVDEKEEKYQNFEANRQEFKLLEAEYANALKVLDHLKFTTTKEDINTDTKSSIVEILDNGVAAKNPFSPNILLNIVLGTFLSSGFGLFMVYFTAYLDNRVKSPYDIEHIIGLPLMGVIPQIRKMDAFGKARIFESGKDNHVKEAFRTIYSSLGVNDNAKDAQVFLNTSTIPGEGKSFVSTNLAFSFAESGDKVLLLDCDLRLPNVAKSLQLKRGLGLLNYIKGEIELADAIQENVYPNLDVMSAGGKSNTPMSVFNDPNFSEMIEMLRGYYDRIIIDSPPLAAVSDALNLVQHADGVLFVVKYDTVKRNTAAITVRKLSEAGKPILGVILNNMRSRVAATFYYSGYYTSQYKKYYGAVDEDPKPPKLTSKKKSPRKKKVNKPQLRTA